jgi:hypothetical protein
MLVKNKKAYFAQVSVTTKKGVNVWFLVCVVQFRRLFLVDIVEIAVAAGLRLATI